MHSTCQKTNIQASEYLESEKFTFTRIWSNQQVPKLGRMNIALGERESGLGGPDLLSEIGTSISY